MAVVLWIMSVIAFMYVLHFVIRSAIDNSETTRLLRAIKQELQKDKEIDW